MKQNPGIFFLHGCGKRRDILHGPDPEQAAKSLRAEPKEIVFTSGGTEANNLALIGTALAMRRRGKHLIAAQFEHASVNSPLLFLEEMGFDIDFVPVDGQGHVCLSRLCSLVRPDTILVSLMYVNNEIGAVQDIAALSAASAASLR